MDWLGKTTRYKIIFIGALIVLLFAGNIVSDGRAYRQAGTQPSDMTVEQVRQIAASGTLITRWIRLTEPVELMCTQAVGWEEEGKISIVVLAFDQSKQQPFWLEYKGKHSCDELKSVPLEGLLVQPDKFWAKQGMVKPSAASPLVELKVGATSEDLRKKIITWIEVEAFGIAMLLIAYIARPRKRAPSRAQTVHAENPWSASVSSRR